MKTLQISLQRELDQWKKENHGLQLQLRKEESMTAQTLQPLVVTLEVILINLNRGGEIKKG